jgi:VIT1/CCC1 family predicted Fe2+/Mn2+ transporter
MLRRDVLRYQLPVRESPAQRACAWTVAGASASSYSAPSFRVRGTDAAEDNGSLSMEFQKNSGARTGLFFGATSGVITTIGLIAGLHAGTRSLTAVLGGIFVIAVADAMSDALGIHLAEEADPNATPTHIWSATLITFVTKFVFSLSFAVPLLMLPLGQAVIASVVWGMIVITVLSYFLARAQSTSPVAIIAEHLGIAILVVVFSHFIGEWVNRTFA